ncbi:MAG TPA: hypothetical protein PK878_14610 [bacterium]|nr:hypothetical protein [bacterium]
MNILSQLLLVFTFGSAIPVIGSTEEAPFRSPAKPMPAGEPAGERPYEMVLAGRVPPHAPLVDFNALDGWILEGRHGAQGELAVSQTQRVWESPVARVTYRGASNDSEITLHPPKPLPIPKGSNAATLWCYGNNWGWVSDPTTPQVEIVLLLQDSQDAVHPLAMNRVNWKEWWLIHKVIPPALQEKQPLRLAGIQIKGCANTEDRELFLEDLCFIRESPAPLTFQPRPKRGVDPFPGQSPGANTGPGRLPFPTREETILPENFTAQFKTSLEERENQFIFRYWGDDTRLAYFLSPSEPFFRGIQVQMNDSRIATFWNEGGPKFAEELRDPQLLKAETPGNGVLRAVWQGRAGDQEVQVEIQVRLWQKSLVLDTYCLGGQATELSYGYWADVENPELVQLPYLNYGGHHLNVLMSKGGTPFFASVWMDWYRSNASQPYAVDTIESGRIQLNGGVRYLSKSDGARNDLFERVFITVSPFFEETLPTIANPPAKRGKEAGSRLWVESWGPSDYEREMAHSRILRAYGIEQLTQCNHEITWRDGGESFTFRTQSAPGKGGDEALKNYIAHQKSLGWRAGLYTNYCDFAPVNEFWDIDMVMRGANFDLVRAWPRCYSPKALFAVEMDRKLAPLIQAKFNTNAAYTDVHTSVSPWDRCDYDSRVPGAGTFAATFYAYGELLLHDQDVYDGHCWSEGHHQWLYAGLCAGNYGLTYSALALWKYPYLPHFDLLKMHPLTVDIGMPWTGRFFEGKEGWNKPENIEASIDQFLAATIAYGHIGWLVEDAHGIRQTCRSYYMLQPLQSRYAMIKPESIRYGKDNGLIDTSSALQTGAWQDSRLFIRYANGLEVWVNGNPETNWMVQTPDQSYTLPPYGWLAVQEDDFHTGSYLVDGRRCDWMSAPESVFVDGRGVYLQRDGIGTAGCVAVRWSESNQGLSIIAVEGVDKLTIGPVEKKWPPNDVRSEIARIQQAPQITVNAFDLHGRRRNAEPVVLRQKTDGSSWEIPVVENAIRYEIQAGE